MGAKGANPTAWDAKYGGCCVRYTAAVFTSVTSDVSGVLVSMHRETDAMIV